MPIPLPPHFTRGDLCTWEVEYVDGTKDKEVNGVRYGAIQRSKINKFRIMSPEGEMLFEVTPPPGVQGNQLIYRRRVRMDASATDGSGRSVVILVGWAPNGPAFCIDVDNGVYSVSDEGFTYDNPDFHPPQAMPGEPEVLLRDIHKPLP